MRKLGIGTVVLLAGFVLALAGCDSDDIQDNWSDINTVGTVAAGNSAQVADLRARVAALETKLASVSV